MAGNYWSNKGKFQSEYDELEKEIKTNDFEDIKDKDLQMVYAIGRIYHDIYNNGGGNMFDWIENDEDEDGTGTIDHPMYDFYEKLCNSLEKYLGRPSKLADMLVSDKEEFGGIDSKTSRYIFSYLEILADEVIKKAHKNYFGKNESVVVSFEKFVMNEKLGINESEGSFTKVEFHSHKNHNPDCDILEGWLDKDTTMTYGINIKDNSEFMEYYVGSNYVTGSSSKKSYSRRFDADSIPSKYISKWKELKTMYEEKYK